MDQRRDLDGRATGIMTLLCLLWGLQQVVLKLAAADVTPLMQIAFRSGAAALLVVALMAWQRESPGRLAETWRPGLLAGGLFGLEFLLVGEGLRFTSASHMVVLLYTAPIFVALGLHWKLPAERLNRLQWLGIALAFGGIAIGFLGRSGPGLVRDDLARVLWGDLLALLAGAAWGATTVAVRLSSLARAPASLTLLYQLAGGFPILMGAAVLLGQSAIRPTPVAIASLAFHSLVICFGTYLTWFWLLKHYLASRLGVFSFLTPLFGVLFGVGILGDPIEANFVLGSLLVLAGVLLVSGHAWVSQRLGAG